MHPKELQFSGVRDSPGCALESLPTILPRKRPVKQLKQLLDEGNAELGSKTTKEMLRSMRECSEITSFKGYHGTRIPLKDPSSITASKASLARNSFPLCHRKTVHHDMLD